MNKQRLHNWYKKTLDFIKRHPQELIIGFFALLVLAQGWNNASLKYQVHQLTQNSSQLIDEMGTIKGFANSFGQELNEARRSLLLPTSDYSALLRPQAEQITQIPESDETVISLFRLIEKLGNADQYQERYQENKSLLDTYLSEESTQNMLAAKTLSTESGLASYIVDANNLRLFTISLAENGEFSLQSFQESFELDDAASFEELKETLEEAVNSGLESLNEHIAGIQELQQQLSDLLKENESIQKVLSEQYLQLSDEIQENEHYRYDLLSEEGFMLASISIDKQEGLVSIGDQHLELSDQEESVEIIIEHLQLLDGRSSLDQRIAQLQRHIASLEDDQGFNSTLEKFGYQFNFEASENEEFISYTISKGEEESCSVLIEKASGELLIQSEEGQPGIPLQELLMRKKKA